MSISFTKCGLHACIQYSKCGLTNDLYSLKIISLLLLVIVLLIKPSICMIPFLSSLNTLLRYLEIAANNYSQILFFSYFLQLFAFHKIFFAQILSALNFICHLLDQLHFGILISSANLRISLNIPSSIPLIKIMKSNGPSIEP